MKKKETEMISTPKEEDFFLFFIFIFFFIEKKGDRPQQTKKTKERKGDLNVRS